MDYNAFRLVGKERDQLFAQILCFRYFLAELLPKMFCVIVWENKLEMSQALSISFSRGAYSFKFVEKHFRGILGELCVRSVVRVIPQITSRP